MPSRATRGGVMSASRRVPAPRGDAREPEREAQLGSPAAPAARERRPSARAVPFAFDRHAATAALDQVRAGALAVDAHETGAVPAAVVHVDRRPRAAHPRDHVAVLEAAELRIREPAQRHVDRAGTRLVRAGRVPQLVELAQHARDPGAVSGPEERTLVARRASVSGQVAARATLLVQVRGEGAKRTQRGLAQRRIAEETPAARERVHVERVRRDLVLGTPVPRLGLDETALDAVRRLQRARELERAADRSGEERIARIAAQRLEREDQEAGMRDW
jgi:hypothetical protein